MVMWIQKTTLTNILRWVIFLPMNYFELKTLLTHQKNPTFSFVFIYLKIFLRYLFLKKYFYLIILNKIINFF